MSPVLDRRDFIRSLGVAAVAGTVPRPLQALLVSRPSSSALAVPRVAVFSHTGFPTLDGHPIDVATLREALADFEVTFLDAPRLDRLEPASFDVYVNPYGSAFPSHAWPVLHDFLIGGGCWVNLGGVPFAAPVRFERGDWRPEVRQTVYHKRLGITQSFPVDVSQAASYQANRQIEAARALLGELDAHTVFELYYRLTRERTFPDEDGSDGPREAVVTPLISIAGAGEHPIAAPVVRVDRLLGPFSGGRWLLANFDGTVTADAIRALVEHAALGVHQLGVMPSFASYREGEAPVFTVALKSPGSNLNLDVICRISVVDPSGRTIAESSVPLEGTGFVRAAEVALGLGVANALQPGRYRVDAVTESAVAGLSGLRATNGFWITEPAQLSGGGSFSADEQYLRRGGVPFIVTGTSYMASDVHRRFLIEPNPHIWNRDFASMKRAGINMVRTGFWTGWRSFTSEGGEPDERVLRALDAFLITAQEHEIPVIFTFFAFLPEAWGGENPYLDPAAVAAQKRFLTRIAERYRDFGGVIWDLINEPSFCSPDHLWRTRPNYDRHEERAWREWLGARYSGGSEEELRRRLAELWRTTPEDALSLPRPEEFNDRHIFEEHHPLKAMDYRLFANDMFTRWAGEMRRALHEAGSPEQLITVGQDEGGTYERPSPMLHAPVVDFASNHTWWLNDDLLWDHVMTKPPDRPLLISETGVMFYEEIDGSAWRTEADARNLLERKLVLALTAGATGFVEWIWNTNPYMPLDNEAAIGLLRADGTAKPEFAVVCQLAAFARESLHDLGPRLQEPVVVMIPHSHMFSARNFATEATRRAVRAMAYHCRMSMSAVSEYALEGLAGQPRLVLVPSPMILADTAWRGLLELAKRGATVLVTGPFERDAHWRPVPRLAEFGVHTHTRPVAQAEDLEIGGALLRLSYRGEKVQRIQKAMILRSSFARLVEFPVGQGRLIWSTLPVELAEQIAPTVALYRHALRRAGLAPVFDLEDPDPGVLAYPAVHEHAVLFGLVSELGVPTTVTLSHTETGVRADVTLPPGRAGLVLVDRRGRRLLTRYEPGGRS